MTTSTQTQRLRLDDLRVGMEVQVPQGRRPWYRILAIESEGEPRRAQVEQVGGKQAGSRYPLSFY